jgi:FAD/FMN-containing dehydrogenase
VRTSTTDVSQELTATIPPDRLLVSGPEHDKSARGWNGAVNHHPAVVVRPRSTADVQAAVLAARNHQLGLSVRGGGHDVGGRSVRDGGLVIDLSVLRQVTVDPATRIATVAGGALTRDVVDAAAPHGLGATPLPGGEQR